jgi:iron-sulfur cluster repair protein YtfE (RIC family)
MTAALQFDPALTINEIVAAHPETIPVFNRFGFDICCGGGVRADEAARRHGIDVTEVFAALNQALAAR